MLLWQQAPGERRTLISTKTLKFPISRNLRTHTHTHTIQADAKTNPESTSASNQPGEADVQRDVEEFRDPLEERLYKC